VELGRQPGDALDREFGEVRAGDDGGGLAVPADGAQVTLDLAGELVELAFGGGESLRRRCGPDGAPVGCGGVLVPSEELGADMPVLDSVAGGCVTATGRIPTVSR
jgi:hypothetical protein